MEETRLASTSAVRLVVEVKKHSSQVCGNVLYAGGFIMWNFRAEIRREFTTPQIGHCVALAPFHAALKLLAIFHIDFLHPWSYSNIGSNSVGNITQAEC